MGRVQDGLALGTQAEDGLEDVVPDWGSIPTVGSSRKRSAGRLMRAMARLTLRFMPPENLSTLSLARSLSPTQLPE